MKIIKILRILALLIYGVIVYYICSFTNGEEIIDRFVIIIVFLIPIASAVYWMIVLDILDHIKENYS